MIRARSGGRISKVNEKQWQQSENDSFIQPSSSEFNKTTNLKGKLNDNSRSGKLNEFSIEIEHLKGSLTACLTKLSKIDNKEKEVNTLRKEIKNFDGIREDLRKQLESASKNL